MAAIACSLISIGCRNRAYSDLYVESMAAEIRQLEDQLYEYDNEYHILEQELASLRAENEQLRMNPNVSNKAGAGSLPLLGPKTNSNKYPELAPRDAGTEELPPKSSTTPPKDSKPESNAQRSAESILEPPGAAKGSETQRQLEEKLPAFPKLPPTENSPIEKPAENLLDIPTIDPGKPAPPGMPVLNTPERKDFSSNSGQPNAERKSIPSNTLELNLSRIEIPNQLASAKTASATSNRAELKLGTEKPADMRIVEIAFHPSLTRAANFDDESDDDGLYLVLQPKNVQGQLVPTFADLDIAVLDPAREGDSNTARIGRWTYSATEVKSKFQPIGSSQGIHLTLPWNGPDPIADRVVVFVRYTLPDGRQVVADKTIFVSGKGNMKTVWVPRGADESQVRTASAEQPITSPSNVVRPNTTSNDPAPAPLNR